MCEVEVETGQLIDLVKNRPVLWNRNHASYRDKEETYAAWISICRSILGSDHDSLANETHTKLLIQHLRKKWANVRDQWIKSQKKEEERRILGLKTRNSMRYRFMGQLSFLEGMYQARDNPHEEEPVAYEEDDDYEEPLVVLVSEGEEINPQPPSPKRRFVDEPQPFPTSVYGAEESPDSRHLMFFKGVVPSLRTFNEEQTIDFQLGVLQLIRSIKNQSSTQNPNNQQSYIPSSTELTVPQQSIVGSPALPESPDRKVTPQDIDQSENDFQVEHPSSSDDNKAKSRRLHKNSKNQKNDTDSKSAFSNF